MSGFGLEASTLRDRVFIMAFNCILIAILITIQKNKH